MLGRGSEITIGLTEKGIARDLLEGRSGVGNWRGGGTSFPTSWLSDGEKMGNRQENRRKGLGLFKKKNSENTRVYTAWGGGYPSTGKHNIQSDRASPL